ncbi:MAG: isoprenyl transferase [bacterium]
MSTEQELLSQLDLKRLPRHVAIIMDGNGRWAKKRRLPRVAGHRVGVSSVKEIAEAAAKLNIEVLTLYAFSIENWKRPATEVTTLMKLLVEYLKKEARVFQKNNIKVLSIGNIDGLPKYASDALKETIYETSQNRGLKLILALNYGAKAELVETTKKIASLVANGELAINEINEDTIEQNLYTRGLPPPDILIRTSGEMRISNFLLWQIAYAEIWITPDFWPDFKRKQFYEALLDYQKRDRRFGGICS